MNILVWAVLGLVLLAVVVWAFRDAQIRMGRPIQSEIRDDENEMRRR